MNKLKYFSISAGLMFLIGVLISACDVGTNPLLFDGTPVEATFIVNTPGTSFSGSVPVNIEDVLSGIKDNVDSVKVFNITMLIDSTKGTNPAITGSITINGDTLLTLDHTPISSFSSERSIFDTTLQSQGFKFSSSIVTTLDSLLQLNPKPTVTVATNGHSSSGPLTFTIHTKLYTQVFTKPLK